MGARARLAVLAVAVLAAVGLATVSSSSADTLTFSATFDNAFDFAAQFDHGYSGLASWNFSDGIPTFQGDHSAADPCGGATTSRTITLSGSGTTANVEQPFYWCAPTTGGGHLMTAIDTVGYNIAWFSPKPSFTGITKVCWDINETELSHRKWTQVVFVDAADAVKYPAGTATWPFGVGYARGSGGFDLGYVSPEFADPNGPTTRILDGNGSGRVQVSDRQRRMVAGRRFHPPQQRPAARHHR